MLHRARDGRARSREEALADYVAYGLKLARPVLYYGKFPYWRYSGGSFLLTASDRYVMVPPKYVTVELVRAALTVGHWLEEAPGSLGVFLKVFDLGWRPPLWRRLRGLPVELEELRSELAPALAYPESVDGSPVQQPSTLPRRFGLFQLGDTVILFLRGGAYVL